MSDNSDMENDTENTNFIDPVALDKIRQNVDWKRAAESLDIQFCKRRSKPTDWWAHSPFGADKTPSFHIKPDKGVWYCFSTKQGGGIIELVQALKGLNCYQAGQWLLSENLCNHPLPAETRSGRRRGNATRRTRSKIEKTVNQQSGSSAPNKPIRQSLLDNLTQQGEHEEFTKREINAETCRYLGCGILDSGRSNLKGRIVFQVRGIAENTDNILQANILTHIGRATTEDQIENSGKWLHYTGFQKRYELYNIDKLLTDPEALAQVHSTGHVIFVEGSFDVAKLIQAGIKNVVATFGSELHADVLPRIKLIQKYAAPNTILIWFDRDQAGRIGQEKALASANKLGIEAQGFNWNQTFPKNKVRIEIPNAINDPCDMSIRQLSWLRSQKLI